MRRSAKKAEETVWGELYGMKTPKNKLYLHSLFNDSSKRLFEMEIFSAKDFWNQHNIACNLNIRSMITSPKFGCCFDLTRQEIIITSMLDLIRSRLKKERKQTRRIFLIWPLEFFRFQLNNHMCILFHNVKRLNCC